MRLDCSLQTLRFFDEGTLLTSVEDDSPGSLHLSRERNFSLHCIKSAGSTKGVLGNFHKQIFGLYLYVFFAVMAPSQTGRVLHI